MSILTPNCFYSFKYLGGGVVAMFLGHLACWIFSAVAKVKRGPLSN